MKKYIILSSINGVGGWQVYTNNKINGVKQYGWEPYAIGLNKPLKTDIFLPYLKEFCNYFFFELNFFPSQIRKARINKIYLRISKIISYSPDDEVVFESTTEELLLWAELFASYFHGKAICVNVKNEFPIHSKVFVDYLYKKMNRGELLFVNNDAMHSLFGNKYSMPISDKYVVSPLTFNELFRDDKDYSNLLSIQKYNHIIGVIGWMDKDYYPTLCEQLCCFAKRHCDRHFLVIVVGKSSKGNIEALFKKRFQKQANLELALLGPLSPIPLNLVQCFDVCVASFGSAVLSDKAGVKTIMMYDHDNIPLGIMGYTLIKWPYHINRTNFDLTIADMLEKVLIDDICKNMPYHTTDYGVSQSTEVQKHIDYLCESYSKKEFFDVMRINESSNRFKIGAFIGNIFGFKFLNAIIRFKNRIVK